MGDGSGKGSEEVKQDAGGVARSIPRPLASHPRRAPDRFHVLQTNPRPGRLASTEVGPLARRRVVAELAAGVFGIAKPGGFG